MGRPEIIGTSRVLLTAGSETTATLLSGATSYLLQNPDVLHRVQSEVRTLFQKAAYSTATRLLCVRSSRCGLFHSYLRLPSNQDRALVFLDERCDHREILR